MAYHPQGNGKLESFLKNKKRELKKKLAACKPRVEVSHIEVRCFLKIYSFTLFLGISFFFEVHGQQNLYLSKLTYTCRMFFFFFSS